MTHEAPPAITPTMAAVSRTGASYNASEMPSSSIGPLADRDLESARSLLARACPDYGAERVAEEKLRGGSPAGQPNAWAARDGDDLTGIAVQSGRWIRILAVDPGARGRGVGAALLARCEQAAASTAVDGLRVLDEPGNYLAPGLDASDAETIGWFERRGFARGRENVNLLIDVRSNPRVTPERAAELVARAAKCGYEITRAIAADAAELETAIAAEWSTGWAFEVSRAISLEPAGVHLARTATGDLAGFAAHDGNNSGLGWFGPAGTWSAHRGLGLGTALLFGCLLDVAAAGHSHCTIAWIGPREFYQRAAGIAGERRYLTMHKDLR